MHRRRLLTLIPFIMTLSGCSLLSEPGRVRTIYLDNEDERSHEIGLEIEADGESLLDETYELASSGAESSETVTGVRQGLTDTTVEARLLDADAENSFTTTSESGCYDLLVRVTREEDVVFFTTPVDGCSE